ncbi:hypothetical protein JRQ81_003439 [Phrynocephalus forsythii]|uniref:Uncharacterized protein n=1 Tax=Phrynocephalus forsythii TaxID=171643 RepID=A0A9Q0XN27_9SAUR|nr:hypothetical protein JRQ81_003439 [Phrynocephalus forsythii]
MAGGLTAASVAPATAAPGSEGPPHHWEAQQQPRQSAGGLTATSGALAVAVPGGGSRRLCLWRSSSGPARQQEAVPGSSRPCHHLCSPGSGHAGQQEALPPPPEAQQLLTATFRAPQPGRQHNTFIPDLARHPTLPNQTDSSPF